MKYVSQFIDESDFGAQIFKDVATVRDLSPEETPVNLDKFHYTVTEGDIDDRITRDDECSAVGFDHSNFFLGLLEVVLWLKFLYVSTMWEIVKEPYILMK